MDMFSVAAASKLLSKFAYNFMDMGLSMGVMVAGSDKRGPGLYYMDSNGERTSGNLYSVDSGSIFAYGELDAGYVHAYTLYRPVGATMMLGTLGNENGAELMMVEPSGVRYGYRGCAAVKDKSPIPRLSWRRSRWLT